MKLKLAAFSISAALAVATAVPAFAAPGDEGEGFGGCIDNFYGNATNERPSGNGVLPSQSPGPFVNNPTDPDNPTSGSSMGDVMQVLTGLGFVGAEAQAVVCTFP
jgi:hypothetical protein